EMDAINKVRERLIVASTFHCERLNLKLTPMTCANRFRAAGRQLAQPARSLGFGLGIRPDTRCAGCPIGEKYDKIHK
ncbi:MAG: hypothetical protein KDJ24_16480, partial [Gammaproteobacteria bacterium]|nr:hypothetical protein [Gammaproteobacteria bacterium]